MSHKSQHPHHPQSYRREFTERSAQAPTGSHRPSLPVSPGTLAAPSRCPSVLEPFPERSVTVLLHRSLLSPQHCLPCRQAEVWRKSCRCLVVQPASSSGRKSASSLVAIFSTLVTRPCCVLPILCIPGNFIFRHLSPMPPPPSSLWLRPSFQHFLHLPGT